MKKQQFKNKQTGFTLIELVVVIVILGILAATAVPRFANLQDNANSAVASGILGAIASSATIQLAENTGSSSTLAEILTETDFSSIPAGTTIAAGAGTSTVNGTGTGFLAGATCDANPTTITVTVGTQPAVGALGSSLCSG